MVKDLRRVNQAKNELIVNQVNDALIDLRNTINKKIVPENEYPDKVIDVAKKILDFHKQRKGEGHKILC